MIYIGPAAIEICQLLSPNSLIFGTNCRLLPPQQFGKCLQSNEIHPRDVGYKPEAPLR